MDSYRVSASNQAASSLNIDRPSADTTVTRQNLIRTFNTSLPPAQASQAARIKVMAAIEYLDAFNQNREALERSRGGALPAFSSLSKEDLDSWIPYRNEAELLESRPGTLGYSSPIVVPPLSASQAAPVHTPQALCAPGFGALNRPGPGKGDEGVLRLDTFLKNTDIPKASELNSLDLLQHSGMSDVYLAFPSEGATPPQSRLIKPSTEFTGVKKMLDSQVLVASATAHGAVARLGELAEEGYTLYRIPTLGVSVASVRHNMCSNATRFETHESKPLGHIDELIRLGKHDEFGNGAAAFDEVHVNAAHGSFYAQLLER